jgi:uncharacterized Zn finger protein
VNDLHTNTSKELLQTMANAKLHIICGNCGCNHMFVYEIVKDIDDDSGKEIQHVYLICKNCITLHNLDDNAAQEQKK